MNKTNEVVILGCGYLGYNIANYFNQSDVTVTVVGFFNEYTEKLSKKNIGFIESDALEFCVNFKEKLENSVVVNCVGNINATNKSDDIVFDIDNNYKSFINLINELSKIKIKKYIHISSGGTVYGESQLMKPWCETDNLEPINIYGLQKVFFEKYLYIKKAENKEFNFNILRLSNPFGGYQAKEKNQGLIPIMIRNCLLKNKMTIWSDIENIRDYIYVDDVCEFIVQCYLNDFENGEVFNVGSGEGVSIKSLKVIIESLLDENINLEEIKN